jgi:hypothetical protein
MVVKTFPGITANTIDAMRLSPEEQAFLRVIVAALLHWHSFACKVCQ